MYIPKIEWVIILKKDTDAWKGKMEDYKRFGFILLAVSAFFYFGLLIRGSELLNIQLFTLIISSIIFILLSGIFLYKSSQYKKKLDELEEDM
jgi:YrhC-like protein